MGEERIDILNRDQFVESLFTIINTLSNNRKSCMFAIDGDWGSGKSFVLNMLEEKLSEWQNEETATNQYMVFHYNCWQYDYYDEPLVAIASALYDDAISESSIIPPKVRIALLSVLCFIGLSTKEFANNIFKELSSIDLNKVHKNTREKIEEYKSKGKPDDDLLSIRESIEATRDVLEEIAEDTTVVVVVDELDRCLPEYAIKVLERLHHLFDGIENLIVVLAVDKNQLDKTINRIFGTDVQKIDSYLKKFISFEVELDKGIINENYKEKYNHYLSLFNENDGDFDIDNYIQLLLQPFDARKRDRYIEKALLIHNLVFEEKVDVSIMCVEMLWIVCADICADHMEFSESTKLPKRICETNPAFEDFFYSEISGEYRLSEYINPTFNIIAYYEMDSQNINVQKQILYYIHNHPYYPHRIEFNKETDETAYIDKNVKLLQKFIEYLSIIK